MRLRPLIGGNGAIASGVIDNRSGRIGFYSFTETSGGGTAKVRLWDGSAAGTGLIASITLLASESTRDPITMHGLPYSTGLYLELVSGTVEGQVFSLLQRDWDEGQPVIVIGTVDVNVQEPPQVP